MLSILIPVYNFDIRLLVAELHRQCTNEKVEFEILCFDDCSQSHFKKLNSEILELDCVTYVELDRNLGRSEIRNRLGNAARHQYLLFMDCDSQVVRKDFIRHYLQQVKQDGVLVGGRVYSTSPPTDKKLFFHWLYGKTREQQSADERAGAAYHSFMSNNFVIPKSIFESFQFDNSLKQYGHEDTLFGMELAQRNIPVHHIDNPLEHIGLEPVEVILAKTRQGLENLGILVERGEKILTKLVNYYLILKKLRLLEAAVWLFTLSEKWMLKNIMSDKPSLFIFDLYKLGYFSAYMKNIKFNR